MPGGCARLRQRKWEKGLLRFIRQNEDGSCQGSKTETRTEQGLALGVVLQAEMAVDSALQVIVAVTQLDRLCQQEYGTESEHKQNGAASGATSPVHFIDAQFSYFL